jgi:phage terminase large subunit-like protein
VPDTATAAPPARKRKTRRKAVDEYGVPDDIRPLLMLLPRYDPFRDAAGFAFEPEKARIACDFFPDVLTHTQGPLAKKPIRLEDWQKSLLMNLWGWRRPNGKRRYRRCLLYLPKKNSKSTTGSGIAILILRTDHEGGARIIGAAAAKKQAGYIFDTAAGMVLQSDWLKRDLKVFGLRGGSVERSIAFDAEASKYYVVASEAKTFDGDNIHAAIIDELHRFDDSKFIDLVEASDAARDNSLILYTTTADYNRKESPCNLKLAKARNVIAGIDRDPTFLPAVWEATEEDDWTSEEVWRRVNPNWGVSVDPEAFRADFQKAVDQPSYRADFKRLRLNIVTDASVVWIPGEKWTAGAVQSTDTTVERRKALIESLRGRECYIGLDLSSKLDLTSMTVLFPELVVEQDAERRRYTSLHYYWVPHENAVAREKRDHVPYLAWREAGWVEFTEGSIVDYSWIRHTIKEEIAKLFTIREIGFDPYGAAQLSVQLSAEDGFPCVEVGQGWKTLSEPCKEFEASILAGNWTHDGSPIMDWNVRNCVAWRDKAGNITPDKETSTERIDGVSATVTALARAMVHGGEGRSVYEARGVDFL